MTLSTGLFAGLMSLAVASAPRVPTEPTYVLSWQQILLSNILAQADTETADDANAEDAAASEAAPDKDKAAEKK